MDCIGRLALRASDREIASQLDRFCDQMDLIASKGLPALCKAAVITRRNFGVALIHALYE
jgi:hypothetical protein